MVTFTQRQSNTEQNISTCEHDVGKYLVNTFHFSTDYRKTHIMSKILSVVIPRREKHRKSGNFYTLGVKLQGGLARTASF